MAKRKDYYLNRLRQLWKWGTFIGVHDQLDFELSKRIRLMNQLAMFFAIINFLYLPIFYFSGSIAHTLFLPLISLFHVSCIFLNYLGFYHGSRWCFLGGINLILLAYGVSFDYHSGIILMFFPWALLPQVLFESTQKKTIILFMSISIIFCISLELGLGQLFPQIDTSEAFLSVIRFCFVITVLLLLAGMVEFFRRENIFHINQLNHSLHMQNQLNHKLATSKIELEQTHQKLEQQHQQLIATQSQLIQSEKMAGLGTLVAGVAHEINNPTNFLYLGVRCLEKDLDHQRAFFLDLLEEEKEISTIFRSQNEQIDSSLKDIRQGSERVKTIVEDLRAFSRLDEAEKKIVSLVESLQSTIRITQAGYKKRVHFITDFQSHRAIECWPAKLNQVFMNLIVNACQAIEKKQQTPQIVEPGTLTIRTLESANPEGYYLIQFEDTGCGMIDEVQKKMFEPFFTTKAVGEGTGMGLSITYGIIEEHKGHIQVKSVVDQGTQITIYLPLSSKDTIN